MWDYTRLPDADLLALVAEDRDQVAFEEFFSRYSRSVYSLMVRQLGDAGWADDVVQEAFISVWRSARTYRPERGAVVGMAVHDRAKRRICRRPPPPGPVARSTPPTAPTRHPRPRTKTAEKLEAFHLHVCIERLPQNEREIIELAYLKGMSQSEIAAELQLPLGTVKTRNRAALLHLAEILEREEHS